MGREVRRVPLDFNWPLRKVWQGFLTPDNLCEPQCPACAGTGYSPEAKRLQDLWYGYIPFKPEDNGSTPYTSETPAVRARAERNVSRAPEYYGHGEAAIRREARRLARHFNESWSHHANADDVAALVAGDRLYDLTHTWDRENGWQPKTPPEIPTPEQVNEWDICSMGHDSINAWVVIRARCEREGVETECSTCGGHGHIEAYPGQRAEAEAWECTDPPDGPGYQLWETVSEGSPISPVFDTAEGLAQWMTRNDCTVDGPVKSFEAAMRFVDAGWAPSFVGGAGMGIVDGVTFMGREPQAVQS